MAYHCGTCAHYSHATSTYSAKSCPVQDCNCQKYDACDCGSVLFHDVPPISTMKGKVTKPHA